MFQQGSREMFVSAGRPQYICCGRDMFEQLKYICSGRALVTCFFRLGGQNMFMPARRPGMFFQAGRPKYVYACQVAGHVFSGREAKICLCLPGGRACLFRPGGRNVFMPARWPGMLVPARWPKYVCSGHVARTCLYMILVLAARPWPCGQDKLCLASGQGHDCPCH